MPSICTSWCRSSFKRVQIRRSRQHVDAGRSSDSAGQRADRQAQPAFGARRDPEIDIDKPEAGIDDQRQPEPDRRLAAVGARQPFRRDEGAEADACQHRPNALQQRQQAFADHRLPDIGDQRRRHHDRRRLRRRHHQPEQANGHRRQTEPDHALDEAGQQKGSRGDGENRVRVHRRPQIAGRRCAMREPATIRQTATQPPVFAKYDALRCRAPAVQCHTFAKRYAALTRHREDIVRIFLALLAAISQPRPALGHRTPRSTIRTGRSTSSSACRPAAASIPSRASSPTVCRRSSASRWWWKIGPAPPAISVRKPCSRRSPTATRCSPRSPRRLRSIRCSIRR